VPDCRATLASPHIRSERRQAGSGPRPGCCRADSYRAQTPRATSPRTSQATRRSPGRRRSSWRTSSDRPDAYGSTQPLEGSTSRRRRHAGRHERLPTSSATSRAST
jgi:hypothetical protein